MCSSCRHNAALKVWPKAPTKFVLAAWEVLGAHEEEDNILFGGWRLHRGGIGTKVCDERVQRIDEPRDGGESLDQAQLPLVVTDRRGIARLFSSRLLAVLRAPRTECQIDPHSRKLSTSRYKSERVATDVGVAGSGSGEGGSIRLAMARFRLTRP